MIILQAPHTLIQTTSVFPSAELGDTLSPKGKINVQRAMDGTTRTYIKSTTRKKLVFNLSMTREKSIEMREFYFAYNDQPIRLTTWDSDVWVVYFMDDRLNIEIPKRGEFCNLQLVFEGEKINGP